MHRKVLQGSHSPILKKEMSEVIMARAGLQNNYFRFKNATNTRKCTNQLKNLKKICNSNLNDGSVKSFFCHKMLGCNKIT